MIREEEFVSCRNTLEVCTSFDATHKLNRSMATVPILVYFVATLVLTLQYVDHDTWHI